MEKWNIMRNSVHKFFKLKNGQWLKIYFSSISNKSKIWFLSIAVADTKRLCNDCIRKPEGSPKGFYGKVSGKKSGLEPFLITLKVLLDFEKTLNDGEIRINAASVRLQNIYKRLLRYGYKITTIKYEHEIDKEIIWKPIIKMPQSCHTFY